MKGDGDYSMLIAADNTTSPWPSIIAAIGGAVVGGLVAFLGAWWQEQRRWTREDRLRWDPARFSAYGRFIEAARLSVNRAELYVGSVLWARRLEQQEKSASNAVEEKLEGAELRGIAVAERPKYLKEMREALENKYVADIRTARQKVTAEHERLRGDFENAADSMTKAAADIELIASPASAQAAAAVERHIEKLLQFARDTLLALPLEAITDSHLSAYREDFEKLLADFETAAKTELTAHGRPTRGSAS
jgi:hypothetical protein